MWCVVVSSICNKHLRCRPIIGRQGGSLSKSNYAYSLGHYLHKHYSVQCARALARSRHCVQFMGLHTSSTYVSLHVCDVYSIIWIISRTEYVEHICPPFPTTRPRGSTLDTERTCARAQINHMCGARAQCKRAHTPLTHLIYGVLYSLARSALCWCRVDKNTRLNLNLSSSWYTRACGYYG